MRTPLPVVRYESNSRGSVAVRDGLRDRHHEFGLCTDCGQFAGSPTPAGSCPIAEDLTATARKHRATVVVWECPAFRPKPAASAAGADTLELCS